MGIELKDSSLAGIIRTTKVLPDAVDQAWLGEKLSYAALDPGIYDDRAQVV